MSSLMPDEADDEARRDEDQEEAERDLERPLRHRMRDAGAKRRDRGRIAKALGIALARVYRVLKAGH